MANIFMAGISVDELIKLLRESIKNELEASTHIQTPPEELLSIDEAAKLLHVSKVTIHKWKKSRLIQFHRIGRRIYFKKTELFNSFKSITLKKKSHV